MKFIMQLPNGSFHVPSAALKISGLEGGDRIEIHTLERAAVIMKQQMNAMETVSYTHLDVYQRPAPGQPLGAAGRTGQGTAPRG